MEQALCYTIRIHPRVKAAVIALAILSIDV